MRIGILGGGQLGRMLALAAVPMGHEVVVLAQSPDEPACAVARPLIGSFDDDLVIERLRQSVDVVTYEFENVPRAAVEGLAAHLPVRPGVRSLVVASDRWNEKTTFHALGIGTAPFAQVDDEDSLRAAVDRIGLPAVLKTRRLGYDGKGQRVLRTEADVPGAFAAIGGVPAILEGFVRFTRELSILGVRGVDGTIVTYPLVENTHRSGILFRTDAPAPHVSDALATRAREAISRLLVELDHVGVLALELFDREGELLANEIAPRVHNTGHFTIEGADTSQFEAHVRAITGEPLPPLTLRGRSVMINLVGAIPPRELILAIPGAHLHLYGKTERPGRKVGHITICAPDDAALDDRVARVIAIVDTNRDGPA
ncbi:MAG: 5-(carboxyamino)imidazole ribonucleotide synthase [Deltaproteobacteria bacterium]|nr:5-(carboxyamino)imidazole ribonucleotide synthase [Deltaproteobacteria bacterium]